MSYIFVYMNFYRKKIKKYEIEIKKRIGCHAISKNKKVKKNNNNIGTMLYRQIFI